ncbi:glycosyltransferase family 4 protein [Micromonospora oryzae]|uniref:glycosyltransferase family 4 protein n=1 Tax=Micromonospora sp. DSM 102119 TaxID=3111768 RepID=UPI0031D688D4
MRVGVVSLHYPPEPNFLVGEMVDELVSRGHEVRVLTGFPHYPKGRTYPGYQQRWRERTTKGRLTVLRTPVYPSHDASPLRRIATYTSFAVSSLPAGLHYLLDVDVIYVWHPPPTTFAAPALAHLLRHVPVLLHVQDLWPEAVTESGMSPGGWRGRAVHRLLDSGVRRLYRSADAIVAISPSMRDLVIRRGATPEKVEVVLNWTEESTFRPKPPTLAARTAIGHRGRCTVMYAGNIGPFQRVEVAVRAAAAAAARMDLVVVGSGIDEDRVRRLAQDLDATNVRFLGRLAPERMADLYAGAEYQVVTLRKLESFAGIVPSKIQSAMACGSPVIVSADGDAAQLVDTAQAGLTCPAEDWKALADRFLAAADLPEAERQLMARRARDAYLERMSRAVGVGRIETILHRISAARSDRRRQALGRDRRRADRR